MKKFLTPFATLLFALLMLCGSPAKATHLMGSDIRWQCLGQDTYLVTVVVYRDCQGIPLSDQDITLKDCKLNTITLTTSAKKISAKDITPVCKKSCTQCGKTPNQSPGNTSCKFQYGVEQFVYQQKVIFTSKNNPKKCCQFQISWENCCRNGAITTGASGESFHVEASMTRCNNGVITCDNSPYFTNPPIAIVCSDQCITLNPGAQDDDVDANGNADSLAYSFDKSMQYGATSVGGKPTYTDWSKPYAYNKPLKFDSFPNANAVWNPPSCAGFHLDSTNGDIQFKATATAVTVISIKVSEYAKDTSGKSYLKGYVHRDMQLIVIKCLTNHVPTLSGIDGTSSNDADFCVNQYTCFTINSDDPDKGDTVTASWNATLASLGATMTFEKKKQHPTSTFCWKPTQADVRTYPYQFVVTATDDACPLNGRTQRSFRIRVHPSPEGVITAIDSGCGNWVFTVTPTPGTFNAATGGTIRWGGDDNISGTGLTVKHHYRLSGDSVTVEATLAQPYTSAVGTKSCPVVITKRIYIPPYVRIDLPRDSVVCKADSPTIFIPSNTSGGTTPYRYKWNVGPTTSSLSAKIVKDTSFYLTVTDNNGVGGCTNTDTMNIKALVPQKPQLGPDQRYCGGASVILRDTSIHDSMGYTWVNIKNPAVSISDSSSATITDSSTYILKVNDPRLTTCFNADTINVLFNQSVVVVPHNYNGCANTSLTMDAGNGKGDTSAIWQWRDLYNPSTILYTGRKVTIIPKKDMHFFVTSYQTYGGLTCGDSDTINVSLYPLPAVKTSKVPDQCFNNPPVDLTGYTTTPGGTWYMPAFPSAVSGGHLYPDSITKLGSPQLLVYVLRSSSTGCKDSTKQAIVIDTIPVVLLKPDTFQCIDDPLPFNLDSSIITPVGGTWSGPAVTKDKFYQNDPQAGGDGVKTFTYTYVNKSSASACSNSANLNITVYRVLSPNAGPDKKSCEYFAADIDMGDGNLSGFSPRWYLDPNGSTPSGALELTPAGQYIFHPAIAGPGDHHIVYEVSHPGHRCPKTDTVLIHVNSNPTISLGSNPPICVGAGPTKLQATPPGVGFTMLDPTLPNALTSSPYFNPGVVGFGTDSVRATYFDKNGCFAESNFAIQIDDTPHVEIIGGPQSVCAGQNVEVYGRGIYRGGSLKLIWPTNPAYQQTIDPNDPNHVTIVPNGTQTVFTVTLKADSTVFLSQPTVCSIPSDAIQVTINPLPVVTITGNNLSGCSPLTPNFKAVTAVADGSVGSQWVWDFGDNDSNGNNVMTPSHTYHSDITQTYNVKVRVTATNGCSATKDTQAYVQVYATPRPWFDAVPFYTTITLPNITFNDSTTINDPKLTRGDLIHRWDFGDGTTSDTREESFVHTYADTGFYTVKLWVKNPQYNCEAETIRTNYIDIRPELIVFIPNAFTPNNLYNERTIVNEKFSPVVANYSSYRLEVFSRWGELLYSTTDITAGWDGKYLGAPCQEGVYIYRVEAVSLEGKKYKYSGSITLLK